MNQQIDIDKLAASSERLILLVSAVIKEEGLTLCELAAIMSMVTTSLIMAFTSASEKEPK